MLEQFLHKNRLGSRLDQAGLRLLIALAGLGWFLWLWGATPPALLAGLALGLQGQMLLTAWRRRTVTRREAALRRRLGGELLLEEMMLSPARQAHFQAAMLLGRQYPLTMLRMTDDGMLCRAGEETLLISCLRMPPGGSLSEGDLVAGQRACRLHGAARGVLCPLGSTPPRIAARAEMGRIPLRIIRREQLLGLAGQFAPATDAQLVELGRRRRREKGASAAQVILAPEKAGRYFLYGLAMLALNGVTASGFYLIAGGTCLALGTVSRCRGREAPKL